MENKDEMLSKFKEKMENKNVMDLNVDDDLLELENEISGKNKKANKKKKNNDSLSLSDLEDDEEIDLKPKKKNRDIIEDDDLAALEKEGLDDISNDEDDNIKEDKKENKTKEKNNNIKEEKINNKIEEKKEETLKEKVTDIYLEYTEKKYHNVERMKCLSVLQNELELCDQIIKFKIDNKFDDEDIWENKKVLAQVRFNNYSTFVQEGSLPMEDYFKIINEELDYENKLLNLIEKDKNLQIIEIPELKNRINKRIELIKSEIEQLKESIEEEKKEEGKKLEEKKEEEKEKKMEEKTEPEYTNEELELLEKIKDRLEEYKKAINYFKANDLSQEKAIELAKEINEMKKKIECHKSNEVNISKLPNHISPEFIFGYSNTERIKKYKEFIEGLLRQRGDLRLEMDNKLEDIKTMPKMKLKKEQPKIKAELDLKKKKINEYDKILKILKVNLQDKWTPAPLFKKEEVIEKSVKINNNIQPNQIRIFVGKLFQYNRGKNVSVELQLVLSKEYNETIEQNSEKSFDKFINWNIDKSDLKHLNNKELIVKLKYKSFFRTYYEGSAIIKLTNLKNNIEIEGEYQLEQEKKQENYPKIEVKIQLRNPCVGEAYEEKVKLNYKLIKIYPSFKSKISHNVQKNEVIDMNIKKEEKIENPKDKISEDKIPINQNKNETQNKMKNENTNKNKKVITNNNQDNIKNQNQVKKQHPYIDKNKFKKEELEDPDIIDNLVSVSVLEFKDKELESKMKKIETRIPRPLRDKSNKIKVKMNFLKNALGDTIDPQGYLNIMKQQLEHDKLLYQYFIQEKDNAKSNIVKIRIQLLFKEINETEQYIKQGGK
jgi:hypothetical protein